MSKMKNVEKSKMKNVQNSKINEKLFRLIHNQDLVKL